MSRNLHIESAVSSTVRGARTVGRSAVALACSVAGIVAAMFVMSTIGREDWLPQGPTDRDLITQIQRLGGRVWVDEQQRVIRVELARLPLGDDDLAVLTKLPHLQWLNLRGINAFKGTLSDDGLRHLSQLTRLRHLNLSANTRLTDASLPPLKNLHRLEWLDLSMTNVTDDGIGHLQSLPVLRRLRVPSTTWRLGPDGNRINIRNVTTDGLRKLAGMPLESLDGAFGKTGFFEAISGLPKLRHYRTGWPSPNDRDLIHLQKLRHLETLSVGLSDGWKNSSRLHGLKGMSGLRVLEMGGILADGETPDWSGLSVLGELQQLEGLRLTGVTDEALASLPAIRSLRKLDLAFAQITGSGLQELARFPNLQGLMLDCFTVTDDGLAQLRHLPQLRVLGLDGTPFRGDGFSWTYRLDEGRTVADVTFTNDGLKHLSPLQKLRVLRLNGVGITDAGLVYLGQLGQLESLGITKSSITDAGLIRLYDLRYLKGISFDGSKVSREAALKLHERLGCAISDNWCCGCMGFSAIESKRD
jgi:F-box/leucine-rich repeat protein 14